MRGFSCKNDAANVVVMNPVTVTPAERADIEAFVGSVAGLFREDGGRHDPYLNLHWPDTGGAAYYGGLLAADDCLLTVARDGSGQVVGHLVGKLTGPDELRTARFAVLESIRVDPAARGRGAGSALIRNFFEWAKEKGAAVASVSAFAANTDAQRLYERHGFSPQTVTLRAPL
jgi:ribosomal protein S18 acetylase RimI-like enzyme